MVEKRKREQAKYRQKHKARMDISFQAGPADEVWLETEDLDSEHYRLIQ